MNVSGASLSVLLIAVLSLCGAAYRQKEPALVWNGDGATTQQDYDNCLSDWLSLDVILYTGVVLDKCSPTDDSLYLTSDDLENEPQSLAYFYAKPGMKYTIMMYYLPIGDGFPVLEWIVCNVDGEDLRNGEVWKGDTRTWYELADAAKGKNAVHQILVFEETIDNQAVLVPDINDYFDLAYFLEQQPIGLDGPFAVYTIQTRERPTAKNIAPRATGDVPQKRPCEIFEGIATVILGDGTDLEICVKDDLSAPEKSFKMKPKFEINRNDILKKYTFAVTAQSDDNKTEQLEYLVRNVYASTDSEVYPDIEVVFDFKYKKGRAHNYYIYVEEPVENLTPSPDGSGNYVYKSFINEQINQNTLLAYILVQNTG